MNFDKRKIIGFGKTLTVITYNPPSSISSIPRNQIKMTDEIISNQALIRGQGT